MLKGLINMPLGYKPIYILNELHWLGIRQRSICIILVLTNKALHNISPPYITTLLTPYTPTRMLWSTSKSLLTVQKYNNVTYGAQALSRFAPSQYTKLPLEISHSPTLEIFKVRIKIHLLNQASSHMYYACTVSYLFTIVGFYFQHLYSISRATCNREKHFRKGISLKH